MRRSALLAALSIIALSSSLAVAPIVHAAFPGQNGRIAYVTTSGDHKVIETVDAQGGGRQPLIDLGSGRDAIDPTWSHDGLKIAFAGQESPGGPFVIYTANADGTGSPQQVTTKESSSWISDTDPTWMPTGQFIAFVRTFVDGTSEIWVVDLATGSTTGASLPGLDASEPAWSPDAGRIAFTVRDTRASNRPVGGASSSTTSFEPSTPLYTTRTSVTTTGTIPTGRPTARSSSPGSARTRPRFTSPVSECSTSVPLVRSTAR